MTLNTQYMVALDLAPLGGPVDPLLAARLREDIQRRLDAQFLEALCVPAGLASGTTASPAVCMCCRRVVHRIDCPLVCLV